jgi:hypothetical protein
MADTTSNPTRLGREFWLAIAFLSAFVAVTIAGMLGVMVTGNDLPFAAAIVGSYWLAGKVYDGRTALKTELIKKG